MLVGMNDFEELEFHDLLEVVSFDPFVYFVSAGKILGHSCGRLHAILRRVGVPSVQQKRVLADNVKVLSVQHPKS